MTTQTKTETFYLNGLSCANCAAKIEDKLKKNEHLILVNFSFATKKLTVKTDKYNTNTQNIISDTVNRIEDGITVDNILSDIDNHSSINTHINNKDSKFTTVLPLLNHHKYTLIGTLLLVIMVINHNVFSLPFLGYFIAYLLIGGDIVYRAIKNLFKGKVFDENFLMSLATIGAFALGEYVEAVAVMLFYKIGEGFQDYAVDHTRKSIKSLLNIKATYANLIKGSLTAQITPETLKLDDLIIIKPGEKVPVDCVLIEGNANIDTSVLTGESMPKNINIGDELLSGSIIVDKSIKAKVTRVFADSTVARILDMVENATGKKAKTEQFITKFARIYTPIVVIGALLLAFIPPTLGYSTYQEWISRALIFLVISCPCALVISVPLGYFGGLGAASGQGILVKGGNYLEALNNIDTYVFDKTGTLTEGNFTVSHKTNPRTLELASILEIHSTHPIASSILKDYNQQVSHEAATNVKEFPGEGLSGIYNNQQLIVGNQKLMKRFNITFSEITLIGTNIYVAYDNHYVGFINITDTIKKSSINLSTSLKALGAKQTIMLTGDQKEIATQVASDLKIDIVYSELLPQDKLTHVEALINNNQRVLFVGDGINDAPVLARADIGVAMGGVGSDAAIEAADIVIMNDDPSKLIIAKRIAAKTRNIVIQNITFALIVKILFLSLGALGEATMYQAIFADVGVSLLAVLNSLRTLKIR